MDILNMNIKSETLLGKIVALVRFFSLLTYDAVI